MEINPAVKPDITDYSGMLQFGRLMKLHRSAMKITQNELADMLNVSRNTIINWETDKSKPDYNMIPVLCSILHIQFQELFNMEGSQELSAEEIRVLDHFRCLNPASKQAVVNLVVSMADAENGSSEENMKNNYKLFYVRPASAQAGTGDDIPDESPSCTILRKTSVSDRADGIVRVNGSSMEPVYHDGEYVYYINTSYADPGEDVLVDTDEGVVIKRIDKKHILFSVNPRLPYPKKSESDLLVIRGKVIGAVYDSDRPQEKELPILNRLFSREIQEFNERYIQA